MRYFGVFGLEFSKTIVIFEISTLIFVKNEFLTDTVNFDIRSAFCIGSLSAFYLDPGSGHVRFVKYAVSSNDFLHKSL